MMKVLSDTHKTLNLFVVFQKAVVVITGALSRFEKT